MHPPAVVRASASRPDSARAKTVIWALSALVVLIVAGLVSRHGAHAEPKTPSFWATTNAVFNLTSAVLLSVGYGCIRRRRIQAHRASMLGAFAASALFLVGYIIHHAQVGSVPYEGTGALRVLYFGLLIPHVLLAGPVLPLALFTIYRGLTGRFPEHRAIARWTLPVWLYVSVSGVLVYLMLY